MYARFNIHIKHPITDEEVKELQSDLYNAALWGNAEDPEVFFEENPKIIGVSIHVDNDPMLLLECGSSFGFCHVAYEKFKKVYGPTWISIHDENGNVLESPCDPTL